jgi:hypothetical protein
VNQLGLGLTLHKPEIPDGTFFNGMLYEINQLAGRNPFIIEQFDNFGTSYRVLEIFKQNIKCIFTGG